MGRKITLEQAIYQGDHIAMFHCENRVPGLGFCYHAGEMRLIELIDSFGPLMRLDDLPMRCTRCGGGGRTVDARARQFRHTSGSYMGPFEEWDGLPCGNANMTWMSG